jgi:hypothetical protein
MHEGGDVMPAAFPDTDVVAWSPLAGLRRMTEARWLIDGVLQQDSTALVFGEPGTFKSFMAMDMAVAIASGQPWQGRQTERAVVIYLAAEGGDAVHLRRAGAQIARDVASEPIPLALVQMRPRLDEPAGFDALVALVERATGRDIADPRPPWYDDYLTEAERDELEEQYTLPDGRMNGAGYEEHLKRLALTRMTAAEKASALAMVAADEALPSSPFWRTHEAQWRAIRHVLLIVDTFAQVASDDTKAVVSRYTQTMRDLQDCARKAGLHLSVLTIDHTTKAGDAYMGSIAKEGNNDTMMMVERIGAAKSLRLSCIKQKDAPDFGPLSLDMVPVTVEGFSDGYGRPLQTLRVTDGERTARLRRAVGAEGDTAAARVLGLLPDGECLHLEELRGRFMGLPDHKDKKADSVKRTFRRAIDSLIEDELIELSDADMVRAAT